MSSEVFMAQNVKCGGCASNIQNGLKDLDGVEKVEVVIESGEVTVEGDNLDRQAISAKLSELGYPEA